MPIQRAYFIEGSDHPVGDGNNQPNYCLLRLDDGSIFKAIIKTVNEKSLATELISAHIMRHWGISVPDPYLVLMPDGGFAFGSKEETYPSLRQSLDFDDELPVDMRHEIRISAAKKIFSQKQALIAIAADEALINFDRHLGNILWNGSSISWIDHEKCLWNSKEADENKLVSLARLLGNFEEIREKAIHSAELIKKSTPPVFTPDFTEYLAKLDYTKFLNNLSFLSERVRDRFPKPSPLGETLDLFPEAP